MINGYVFSCECAVYLRIQPLLHLWLNTLCRLRYDSHKLRSVAYVYGYTRLKLHAKRIWSGVCIIEQLLTSTQPFVWRPMLTVSFYFWFHYDEHAVVSTSSSLPPVDLVVNHNDT